MALVWQKEVAGNRYEVRSHGATVRLYSNGVFHSQWNPNDPLKGSLWELLLLPVFFLPIEQVRSVLVLGVGGGAVIRLLQQFVQPAVIVGVDLDPQHLMVARTYFGVRNAELVCADAREYVAELCAASPISQFDLIIDDLFGHHDGEAERTVAADVGWCQSLLKLLSPDGLLVSNFGSRKELQSSGWRAQPVLNQLTAGWTAELPDYENCIAAVCRAPLLLSTLHDQSPTALNPCNPSRKLDSRLRRLS